jgi:hypothetical protein
MGRMLKVISMNGKRGAAVLGEARSEKMSENQLDWLVMCDISDVKGAICLEIQQAVPPPVAFSTRVAPHCEVRLLTS